MTPEDVKKIEVEDGYILTDGDSEVDYDSMFEPSKEYQETSTVRYVKKEVSLKKDNIEYRGKLKKFLLKETDDGKTIITVVFELNK